MSSDARFFARGKVQELRNELQMEKKEKNHNKKRIVLKKVQLMGYVIANMTMSNDMSPLFPEIIQCMAIPDLGIKKMCFLFLTNYARSKPEIATKALPILVRDFDDVNPLIRALALRTASYMNIPDVIRTLFDPISDLMEDPDPYVRKTAAMSVAKLHYYDPQGVVDKGLVNGLKDLLGDSNSTVVANALASLMDILSRTEGMKLNLDYTIATKLVSALNECSEWNQTYILEALIYFTPKTSRDAETLAERIAPRLQHANSGVVLTCIRVIIYLTNYISNEKEVTQLYKKLTPPLVTLLARPPEVQFIALRNAHLILLKRPEVWRDEVQLFFCKYNDPIYVKLAKLEIIVRLANRENISQVLNELKEYATEVDVDFVRKAVRSIGRLAVKIESAARDCISVLLELVSTRVSYVVQEATVVIRDIFRKYPNQYESIIAKLCENLDSLDEPEAKAAMIWIIGQYADRIENADVLLDDFLFSFKEETIEVQLALLTATVKLFIQRPTKGQDLVPKILKWATEECDNPDVRDRGFMYWRLLSTDTAAAKQIVMGETPQISLEREEMDDETLEKMCLQMGCLGSVYHKLPEQFIRNGKSRTLPESPALVKKGRSELVPTTLDVKDLSSGSMTPSPGGYTGFDASSLGYQLGNNDMLRVGESIERRSSASPALSPTISHPLDLLD